VILDFLMCTNTNHYNNTTKRQCFTSSKWSV